MSPQTMLPVAYSDQSSYYQDSTQCKEGSPSAKGNWGAWRKACAGAAAATAGPGGQKSVYQSV
eukprot:scaffold64174_cov16-Tisochrysis_lutea.AAC.1